jgi:anthranilate synthase component II
LPRVREVAPDRIILSPGPGRPEDAGVCLDVLEMMSRRVPTLGVCLGHQAIYTVYGGEVIPADHLMHGKVSSVQHDGKGIFSGLSNPFTATRYHSLRADPASLPDDLIVSAVSADDGYIMGVRHRAFPVSGIQFHPESILTPLGGQVIRNFVSGGGV